MATIVINDITDVNKIQLGDSIIIAGDEDPIKYYEFYEKAKEGIDKRVSELIAKEEPTKEEDKVKTNNGKAKGKE